MIASPDMTPQQGYCMMASLGLHSCNSTVFDQKLLSEYRNLTHFARYREIVAFVNNKIELAFVKNRPLLQVYRRLLMRI